MARLWRNPSLPIQHLSFLPAPVAFFMVSAAIFSAFSILTFLCASHRGVVKSLAGKGGPDKKTVRLGGEKKGAIEKMKSGLSSKALLVGKMISWKKVQDEDHEFDYGGDDQDGAVWKKTIIRGEKCRPIDFSGNILYDNDGNLLKG